MKYLLDTKVISETSRKKPDPKVAWVGKVAFDGTTLGRRLKTARDLATLMVIS